MDLAEQLRTATWPLHRQVESSAFMRELMQGQVGPAAYCRLLRSLHALYEALETVLSHQGPHDLLTVARLPGLARAPALAADLAALHGPAWRDEIGPCASASDYATHLHRLGDTRPERLLAHAYVRYLGDLSGGQVLRRVVARALGLRGGEGTRFYDFGDLTAQVALGRSFREGLAGLRCDTGCEAGIVDEAVQAFVRHGHLFDELQRSG